jgi:hypothetical protein
MSSFQNRYKRSLISCLLAFVAAPFLQGAATTTNPGLKYYYPAPEVPVVDVEADVIVYGGTSGGVVAAVQAARMGKNVALIVFGRHVGGMTSGGLTATDGVNSSVQGGITREYFDATGNAGFRPSEAEQEFENLLADPVPGATWDTPVPTYYEQRIDTVEMDGTRILALHMENGSVFRGRMFIDCSYEGDLLARAGVSYTYGRESQATYGESRAGTRGTVSLPGVDAYVEEGSASSGLIYNLIDEPAGTVGAADDHVQAYNFRMYTSQNSNPASIQPLFEPEAYNADDLEILYRYHRSGGTTSMSVGNDINNHEMFNRGCSTDHIGGNRWPDGNGGWIPWADADYSTRELIYQSHVAWQLGMLWYIKTDSRYRALATDLTLSATIRSNIQSLLNKVDQLGFPLGENPETGGWPHELYVREARRMVSDFVVTQAYYDRDLVAEDSVGLANYSADSHHVRRIPGSGGSVLVEGDTGGSSATPWGIPYRALVPKSTECSNLLVTWAISASHVAFCSMRMEPCHMVLSQSAATAAVLCLDRGEAVQDLPYSVLRRHLLADGQILGQEPILDSSTVVDDSGGTGFSTSGTWLSSSASSGYYGSGYLHDDNVGGGNSASFIPNLDSADDYGIYLRWTSHTNRADNVPVDVLHDGGTTSFVINQKTNGGTWVLLGTFHLTPGAEGGVVLTNEGANGYVIADAVQFVPLNAPPPPGSGLQIIAKDNAADEDSDSPGLFQIVNDEGPMATDLTVYYSIGGSAVADSHYVALPASVIIPGGQLAVDLEVSPVPDSISQGTREVTVTLQPDADYTIGFLGSATVSIRDKPYDAWRYRRFATLGLENSPESDLGANPDHDDKINRLEFLLGSNPMSGVNDGGPEFTHNPGDNSLQFVYRHSGEARGITPSVQVSESLDSGSWSAVAEPPTTVQWDPDTGDRIQESFISLEGFERLFIRLEIP